MRKLEKLIDFVTSTPFFLVIFLLTLSVCYFDGSAWGDKLIYYPRSINSAVYSVLGLTYMGWFISQLQLTHPETTKGLFRGIGAGVFLFVVWLIFQIYTKGDGVSFRTPIKGPDGKQYAMAADTIAWQGHHKYIYRQSEQNPLLYEKLGEHWSRPKEVGDFEVTEQILIAPPERSRMRVATLSTGGLIIAAPFILRTRRQSTDMGYNTATGEFFSYQNISEISPFLLLKEGDKIVAEDLEKITKTVSKDCDSDYAKRVMAHAEASQHDAARLLEGIIHELCPKL